MSCQTINCCAKDEFAAKSDTAPDARGSVDSEAVAGFTNPNCPVGYIWGGLACVREQAEQVCSTGYTWDGTACVADE